MYHSTLGAAFAAFTSISAFAGVTPFAEDFNANSSNWFDSAGTAAVNWSPTGGPDGGAYATTGFNFLNSFADDTPLLFRAQDEFNSSGNAFVGDWLASGITELSFMFRHNAPVPLNVFTRFATPANFPGINAIDVIPVLPNTWTQITVDISASNPFFIFEGPPSIFPSVFGNIGHVQIGVSVPLSLAGLDQNFTFDLDKVQTVPAPGALAVFMGWMGMRSRRRRMS